MAKRLTDEQVDLIIEKLINRTQKANTVFLKGIGSSIKKLKNLTPSQAHKLAQILKYGGNYEEIVKEINKYSKLNIDEIDKIFDTYAKKDQMFYKQFYEYRDVPFVVYADNPILQRQTRALRNLAKNKLYDFTRSRVLGYTIRDNEGNVVFKGLREIYNEAIDTALLNVGQGKETFDTAVFNILNDIGGSGLKTLEFESGRHMRLDSAIRTHLKSRLRELHNENQKIFGEEFGADGIEVSVHLNPAPDHADIQGRQFDNKKKKGGLTDWDRIQLGEIVKDYTGVPRQLEHSKSGGYRPISELNCYHYIFPVVLGINKPEYTNEQLDNIIEKNKEGFELDGRHYTMYEGTQLQRMLESKIREQKDIQIIGKASDNSKLIAKAQQKITQLTQKYRELSQISGLPTKNDRLRVSGYRRTKVNR